jgi:hypothetical protein
MVTIDEMAKVAEKNEETWKFFCDHMCNSWPRQFNF